MYPESRRFGGSRQSRTFVNIDPPPSARKGRTRSANVCLRFLEALMRFANRRPFDNFSVTLNVSRMTNRVLNHVTRESQVLNLQAQHLNL